MTKVRESICRTTLEAEWPYQSRTSALVALYKISITYKRILQNIPIVGIQSNARCLDVLHSFFTVTKLTF